MSSQPTPHDDIPTAGGATESAGAIARFLVAMILFIGGVVVMGWAFTVDSAQPYIFGGGMLLVTLGFFLPMSAHER
ncbi:hypothetical protein [Oerskovia flava]|uniref:hypothetical protein n=1 Tax=Oerskovia flava TaxID=2986422 RepID=UPI002240B071|nr:hypothetical protein [Oerskovia sp. JB1-3-2]